MSISFLLTSLIVVATPGTGVIYTMAAGLSRGARASVIAAIGCTLGIVPHMLAAITGLAALLQASPLAFQILKYLGVAYLVVRRSPHHAALRERHRVEVAACVRCPIACLYQRRNRFVEHECGAHLLAAHVVERPDFGDRPNDLERIIVVGKQLHILLREFLAQRAVEGQRHLQTRRQPVGEQPRPLELGETGQILNLLGRDTRRDVRPADVDNRRLGDDRERLGQSRGP